MATESLSIQLQHPEAKLGCVGVCCDSSAAEAFNADATQ